MTHDTTNHLPVSANPDGVDFDSLLNELYAFEDRCQAVHDSIENRDPRARRQALELKRDIHSLRKTIEKQGIE